MSEIARKLKCNAMMFYEYKADNGAILRDAANRIEFLEAAGEMSEWQPIETAPKDGSEIMAVRMYEGSCVTMGVASFGPCRKQHNGYVAANGESRWRNQGKEKLFPTPTHWQRLPEPPKGIEI